MISQINVVSLSTLINANSLTKEKIKIDIGMPSLSLIFHYMLLWSSIQFSVGRRNTSFCTFLNCAQLH